MTYKILVIDNEQKNIDSFRRILEPRGYIVHSATNGMDAAALVRRAVGGYALAIADYLMPDMNGALTTKLLLEIDPGLTVVTCSGDTSADAWDENLNAGSVCYLERGMDVEKMVSIIRRYCRKFEETRRVIKREPAITGAEKIVNSVGMVGRSRHLAEVADLIKKYGPSGELVFIRGENGSGKEVVAKAIHEHSPVRNGPFVAINCTSLSSNLLESELFGHAKGSFTGADKRKDGFFFKANDGTIFLDEIGDLPPELQVKLLRVIQEEEYTPVGSTETLKLRARIIAATNVDIQKAIEKGRFREDLFYRLNVLPIVLNPLRDRLEDIEPLVAYFTEKKNKKDGTSKFFLAPAVTRLRKYSWPGNVRELENLVTRAMVLAQGDLIGVDALDINFFDEKTADEIIEHKEFMSKKDGDEKEFILRALSQNKTIRDTAKQLNMPLSTLHGRMATLGIVTKKPDTEEKVSMKKSKIVRTAVALLAITAGAKAKAHGSISAADKVSKPGHSQVRKSFKDCLISTGRLSVTHANPGSVCQ